MSKIKWNDENVATLVGLVGEIGDEVSQDLLATAADTLETTPRSIGAKLRNLGYTVAKAAPKVSAWSESQEAALVELVNANPETFTYAELAASFENGAFTAKQIQGKLLSLELFDKIRRADKIAAPRTYTEAEEARFVELAKSGATIETLSETFNKPVASIRGKALSLLKGKIIDGMPKQEASKAKDRADIFDGLDVASMTTEELAEKTDRSERGIKSTLSRRGISCANYDGAAKRAKLDEAK